MIRKAFRPGKPSLLILALFLLATMILPLSGEDENQGAPVMNIHRIDTTRYPELDLTVSVHPVYPEYADIVGGDEARLSNIRVEERFRDAVVTSDSIEVQPMPARADVLYLVMVLDFTRSIPEKDFQAMKADARYLLGGLSRKDLVAIYSFNNKPRLEREFTRNHREADAAVASLERIGHDTNVYDALYSGLYSARSAYGLDPHPADIIEQSAVLIFTDGQDEKSTIQEEDLHEIAKMGSRYRIPVYTLFYGEPENRDTFQRLAMKTGGEILSGAREGARERMLDTLRRVPAKTFRIMYRSSLSGTTFPLPGSKSELTVALEGAPGPARAIARYEIPFADFWLHTFREDRLSSILLIGSVLLLLLIVLAIVWIRIRRGKGSKEHDPTRENAQGTESHGVVVATASNESNATGSAGAAKQVASAGTRGQTQEDDNQDSQDSQLDDDRIEEDIDEEEEIEGVYRSDAKKTSRVRSQGRRSESENRSGNEFDREPGLEPDREPDREDERYRKNKAAMRVENERRLAVSLFDEADGPVRVKSNADSDSYMSHPAYPDDYDPLTEVESATGVSPGLSGRGGLYIREYSYHLLQQALRGAERYQDATLKMRQASSSGDFKEYDLFLENTLIGSGRYANIRLDDPSIMAVHARIKKVDGKFVLYDMMSRSGVYLNEKKLLRPRALRDGDELQLGRVRFRFAGTP